MMTEKQINKLVKQAAKMKKFIRKIAFENDYQPAQDRCLSVCKGCGKAAWLIEDIKHKRNCQINKVLK